MNKDVRAKTKEEIREEFLNYLRNLSSYWANSEHQLTEKERCDGLVFSILATIDGDSYVLPAIDLIFRPHPEDKQYKIDTKENYIEDGICINDDIFLHEIWYKD